MKSKRNHLIVFLIVSGLFFFSGVTASADCPADLISYWPLNETIPGLYADALNVNPGVTAGDDPVPADGIVNGAQLFAGANGIDAAADTSLDFGSEDSFSFAVWMKISSGLGSGEVEVLLGRDDSTTGANYWVGIQEVSGATVAAAFLRSASGEGDTINGTTDLNDGKWHYIVFVRNNDGNTNKLYVDGVLENDPGLVVDYTTGFAFDGPFTIGYLVSPELYLFNGAIDEVAVYGAALPPTEIVDNFNNKVNLCGDTALTSVVSGDFNGDGRQDLAGVSPSGEVYYSTSLGAWVNIPGVVQSIVAGDFDGDGDDDIAGINPAGAISKVFYTTDLATWTGIPGLITSIVTGDFNGDGNDDIAGINPAGVSFKVFYTTDLATWTGIPGLITSIVAGDFNGDGNDDIAGINPAGVSFKVFYTTNLDVPVPTWTGIPGLITSITTGDFNDDGNDDIAGINPDGVISKIFYTTNLATWTPVPGLITSIVAGDFDGDGVVDDIAGINPAGVSFKAFYTTDLANWTGIPTVNPGSLDTITAGDFDADGVDDLAGVNSMDEAYYTLNFADWTYIP